MKQLPSIIIEQIRDLAQKKCSSREIAHDLNISQSTVIKYCRVNGGSLLKGQQGRKRLVSQKLGTAIRLGVAKGNLSTTEEVKAHVRMFHGLTISKSTANRTLKRLGFVSRRKIKKPLLKDGHRLNRYRFARLFRYKDFDYWKKVWFTDETIVRRLDPSGNLTVWLEKDRKTFDPRQLAETAHSGGGGLLLWGCFCSKGVGQLHCIDETLTAKYYIDILRKDLARSLRDYEWDDDWYLLQDNSAVHTAKKVQDFLEYQQIKTIKFPAKSPDLNPIENIWAILKRRLYQPENPAADTDELWDRIKVEWKKITPDLCHKLVESMPRRLNAVIKRKGRPIKY